MQSILARKYVMKLLQTIIFILFSIIAQGQDITYTLTHGGSRKWIAVDKTKTLSGQSSTDIVFHANHKIETVPVNSHRYPIAQTWQLITGNTTRDENITLLIGGIDYSAIFSKTSNGSDFITLTCTWHDRAITKSYYSE